jgi:molybdate transport system substrate-binding protein
MKVTMETLARSRTRSLAALATLLAALWFAAPARADYPPDVVVSCEPTLKPVLAEIAAAFRRQTGIPVILFAAPTASLLEQIGHHARTDLVVGEGEAAADDAARRGLVKPETRAFLWRNRLVVAAPAGTALAPGDAASRIGDGEIAVVDPPVGTAGADSRRALAALGLWPALQSRTLGTVNTADASFLLTRGKAQRAVLYASDVAAAPALMVAASLPDAAYPPIVYWAAETQHEISTKTADFAHWLRGPAAAERARAAGLEVLP